MSLNIPFSDVISAVALVVSVFSVCKSIATAKTANDLTKEQNEIAKSQAEIEKGQVEIDIRNMILTAQYHYSEMCLHLSKEPDNKVIQQQVMAALESVANAYDEACTKYIDGKTDKNRFKKTYANELRKWVESEYVKDKYIMPHSQYKATIKVYDEWNNLEK